MRLAAAPILAFAVALAAPARGQEAAPDPRIRTIVYAPDQVVEVHASPGYAVVVELGEDERIDTIVVGDSDGWQVTATKRADQLVIKPASNAFTTNMVVTTDNRRHVFVLRADGAAEGAAFVLRFQYPGNPLATATADRVIARYSLKGAKSVFPVEMSDDGRNTMIRWDVATPLPAIVAVDGGGREAVVNGRMVNGTFVVEGIAKRYIFRRDKDRAIAVRRPVQSR